MNEKLSARGGACGCGVNTTTTVQLVSQRDKFVLYLILR